MARSKLKSTKSWILSPAGYKLARGHMMAARKSAPGVGGFKRKRRAKPGVKAAREVIKLSRTTDLQIAKLRFYNLVREIGWDYKTDLRWSKLGVIALHEAAEDFLTHLFEESLRVAEHAKRETVLKKDVKFARKTLMGFRSE